MNGLNEAAPLRIDRNFELPSIPLVLTRIIQVLGDGASSAHELEDVILHDPSLSARILRLANSAFYSFRCEVKTISHAIMLLGINLVKSLAMGVNIFDSFTRGMKNEAALIQQLWMHSFGVGLLTQEIWVRRHGRNEGDFAFLCGLLHDLGKMVFFKSDPAYYARIFAEDGQPQDRKISSVEYERYDIDHAAAGAMLAKHWGLPPDLAAVIRMHHTVLQNGIPLVAAVAVADILTKQNGIGFDGDSYVTPELPKLQAQLDMGDEEFQALTGIAATKRKEVEDFFLVMS